MKHFARGLAWQPPAPTSPARAPSPNAPRTLLVGRFLTDYYRLVAEWADWATALVRQWPDDPRDAVADPRQQAETARRADWPGRLADAPGTDEGPSQS
ncbi:hypothetical protein [Streptomyces sp. NPDC050416]|uniref:hypothetical protein n=1 Tax=Streptomyces sp. NPDC050416 TaxID=3365611 RepID=UPI0037AC465C